MQDIEAVDRKRAMLALSLLMISGMGTIQMQPVLGGALVDRMGLTLQQIGLVFGMELVPMAIACAVAAAWADRYDRRRAVRIALALLLVASALSVVATDLVSLCAARFLAGVSGGVVQAIVYASTSMRSRKDRSFAVLNIVILLWGAVSLGAMPPLLQARGIGAVFMSFVVLTVLSVLVSGLVPRRPAVMAAGAAPQASLMRGRPGLLLALFVLLFAGHGALWVYQERIGKAIGVSPEHIGMILGLSVTSGAVGAALAGAIGSRISHRAAQMIGFAGALLATVLMVYGQSLAIYAVTAFVIMLVWFFGLTYMLSLAAEMDPAGRLPGLANAAIFVGQGLGPAVGGLVVGQGDFRLVGWASAGLYAVAMVISLAVTADRRPGAAAERVKFRSA